VRFKYKNSLLQWRRFKERSDKSDVIQQVTQLYLIIIAFQDFLKNHKGRVNSQLVKFAVKYAIRLLNVKLACLSFKNQNLKIFIWQIILTSHTIISLIMFMTLIGIIIQIIPIGTMNMHHLNQILSKFFIVNELHKN
jgi:hypothetical protein